MTSLSRYGMPHLTLQALWISGSIKLDHSGRRTEAGQLMLMLRPGKENSR